jgi:hypothetical protein
MDCRTARLLLEFVRPHATELEADDADGLEAHLCGCPECEALARSEHQLDDHIGHAIRDVPVPLGLRERILDRLGRERQDCYRRWMGRCLRVVAGTAALFLIAYLALQWRGRHLPRLDDPEEICKVALAPVLSPSDRQQTSQWFRSRGAVTELPPRFDFAYPHVCGFADFKDQQVPHLIFMHERTHAEVYILSPRQFDFGKLGADRDFKRYVSPSGDAYKVQVWREANGYFYVIVYCGDLNDLLETDQQFPT